MEPVPLTASQARAAMLAYHASRETTLIDELTAKIAKSASNGYKTMDRHLKGYQPSTLQAVVETFGGRGFTVTLEPVSEEVTLLRVEW